jgi:hypothetical protein
MSQMFLSCGKMSPTISNLDRIVCAVKTKTGNKEQRQETLIELCFLSLSSPAVPLTVPNHVPPSRLRICMTVRQGSCRGHVEKAGWCFLWIASGGRDRDRLGQMVRRSEYHNSKEEGICGWGRKSRGVQRHVSRLACEPAKKRAGCGAYAHSLLTNS